MTNVKNYPVNTHSAADLINRMYDYLSFYQHMETQRIYDEYSGSTVLQARTPGGAIKQVIGLDKAVTVRFTETTNGVSVEIGEGKWLDKSIVMTTSMFILWPLAVTSGVGIYKQKKLLKDIEHEIDNFMWH